MKLIQLTKRVNGKNNQPTGLFAIVDDQDYEELINYKWNAAKGSRNKSYVATRIDYKTKSSIAMHRKILGIIGVSYSYTKLKSGETNISYRAAIMKNYKHTHIGTFATENAAAIAYDIVATKLHKQFANLNFPERIFQGNQPCPANPLKSSFTLSSCSRSHDNR